MGSISVSVSNYSISQPMEYLQSFPAHPSSHTHIFLSFSCFQLLLLSPKSTGIHLPDERDVSGAKLSRNLLVSQKGPSPWCSHAVNTWFASCGWLWRSNPCAGVGNAGEGPFLRMLHQTGSFRTYIKNTSNKPMIMVPLLILQTPPLTRTRDLCRCCLEIK